MSAAQIAFAAAVAVTAQTSLAWLLSGTVVNLDLPLVVVVLAGLSRGALGGLWTGTAAGFAQDLLSGGLVGVSGLCKSVVGVAAGLAGERLLVTAVWQWSLILAAATFVHAACFFGTYVFIPATTPIGGWPDVAAQAVANALAGGVVLGIARTVPWRRPPGRRVRTGFTVGQWRTNHAP